MYMFDLLWFVYLDSPPNIVFVTSLECTSWLWLCQAMQKSPHRDPRTGTLPVVISDVSMLRSSKTLVLQYLDYT